MALAADYFRPDHGPRRDPKQLEWAHGNEKLEEALMNSATAGKFGVGGTAISKDNWSDSPLVE